MEGGTEEILAVAKTGAKKQSLEEEAREGRKMRSSARVDERKRLGTRMQGEKIKVKDSRGPRAGKGENAIAW